MSRPRFLADNDLNETIVDGVLRREPSIEFIRAREVGLQDRPDPEVLNYAAAHSLLIISHDVNTMIGFARERLEDGKSMPGLLMVRQAEPVANIIESLILIWSASEHEEWAGVIEFLPI